LQVASFATCARSSRAGTNPRISNAPAWDKAGWLDEATAWIDSRVKRSDDLEVLKTAPWSAVVRVPTAEGDVWFKENPPQTAFEPALTELLARSRGDAIPEVVAWEGGRMLTRDAGRRLRAVHDAGATQPAWEELLRLYAELQIEFADEADVALELGTPNERVQTLAGTAAQLSADEDAVRRVAAAAARLSDTLAPTVVHMEAHDGNIFLRNGSPVLIDWAEAVVTHPFLGPLLPLRFATERLGYAPGSPEVRRLRDAYLEPFTSFAPLPELRASFSDAYLLAPICRAHEWHEILAPLRPSVTEAYGDPVRGWLGILRGLLDGSIALGGA
jgi:hypothetical protein